MKNCRMCILQEAYKLFLVNNMEKVTISELEKAVGRARGTIFYHFNGKQNLFECIVNEIFLPQLDIPTQMYNAAINDSFARFVESYTSPEERAIEIISKKYHIPDAERCYFNFLSEAYKYSPNFQEQYAQIFSKEIEMWKEVVERNKNNNLSINSDLYLLADIIMFFKTGTSYSKGHSSISGVDYDKIFSKLCSCLVK